MIFGPRSDRAHPAGTLQVDEVDPFVGRCSIDPQQDRVEIGFRNLFLRQILVAEFVIRPAWQHGTAPHQRLLFANDRAERLQVVGVGEDLQCVAHLVALFGADPVLLQEPQPTVLVPGRCLSGGHAAITQTEAEQQRQATVAAQGAQKIFDNRYVGGLGTYLQVVTAQNAALMNERNDIDIMRRRMDASVLLIKALGGGWTTANLPKY